MIKENVLKSFTGRDILVTGGTGLIARQITNILCAIGVQIKIVSLDKININDKADYIYGDLTSFEFCKLIHYYLTTSLLDGMKETWNWYVKNHDEYLSKKNYFK